MTIQTTRSLFPSACRRTVCACLLIFTLLLAGCQPRATPVSLPAPSTAEPEPAETNLPLVERLLNTLEAATPTSLPVQVVEPSPTAVEDSEAAAAVKYFDAGFKGVKEADLTKWDPALRELMLTNGGCRLPCWWGITPGVTTWDEAEAILAPFLAEPDDIYQGGHLSLNVPEQAGRTPVDIGVVNDVVNHIYIQPWLTTNTYRLEQVLAEYPAIFEPTIHFISEMINFDSEYSDDVLVRLAIKDIPANANFFFERQGYREITDDHGNTIGIGEFCYTGIGGSIGLYQGPGNTTQPMENLLSALTNLSQADFVAQFSQPGQPCIEIRLTP